MDTEEDEDLSLAAVLRRRMQEVCLRGGRNVCFLWREGREGALLITVLG
jgi:hypothetical protein